MPFGDAELDGVRELPGWGREADRTACVRGDGARRMRGPEGVEDLVVRLEPAAARYLRCGADVRGTVAVIGGGNIVLSVIGAQPPVGMYVPEVGGPRACAAEEYERAEADPEEAHEGLADARGRGLRRAGVRWGNLFRWESPAPSPLLNAARSPAPTSWNRLRTRCRCSGISSSLSMPTCPNCGEGPGVLVCAGSAVSCGRAAGVGQRAGGAE